MGIQSLLTSCNRYSLLICTASHTQLSLSTSSNQRPCMLNSTFRNSPLFGKYLHSISFAIILIPIVLFSGWVYNTSFNMISRDEYRIAGIFIKNFHQSLTFKDYLNAFFIQENESRPIVVRLLYLLTYWVEGTVDFRTVCMIGNLEMLTFLYILWLAFKKSGISLWYFIPIPFITLNFAPYYTFLFSYETYFYVSSFFIPIAIFYTATLQKSTVSPYLLTLLCLGVGSVTSLVTLLLIILRLLEKKYVEALLFGLILFISFLVIPKEGVGKDTGTILEIIHNWKSLSLLVFAFIGNFFSIFVKNGTMIIGVGILVFCMTSMAIVSSLKWKNTYHRFLSTSFLFFLMMFFFNCVRRWRHDYEGYLVEIINGHKIIFSVSLCSICYLIGLEYIKHKKIGLYLYFAGLGLMSLSLYLMGNFNNLLNATMLQKKLHTDIGNWKLSNNHPNDPYNTYTYMVKNKLFKHGESFDDALIDQIQKRLKDTNHVNKYYPIEIKVEKSDTKNTYNIFVTNFTISCSTYPCPTLIDHTNGIYVFLISKSRTIMFPANLTKLSIRKLFTRLNAFNDGFYCQASTLDVPLGNYQIAICNIQNKRISDLFFVEKHLIL